MPYSALGVCRLEVGGGPRMNQRLGERAEGARGRIWAFALIVDGRRLVTESKDGAARVANANQKLGRGSFWGDTITCLQLTGGNPAPAWRPDCPPSVDKTDAAMENGR